jgi:hypothetical protein
MPRVNQNIIFSGGVNFDTHLNDIPEGDYRYALNMRNTRTTNGNWGGAVNVMGNVLVPYQLPQGDNITIGRIEDKVNKSVDFFVWNSLGKHRILTYRSEQNDIVELLVGDFKFNKDWMITHPSLIDGVILQWTDGKESGDTIVGNPLRYIDKKRAYLFNKKVSFNIIASSADFNKAGTYYTVKVYNNGVQVTTQTLLPLDLDRKINDKQNLYLRLENAINNNAVLASYLKADDCGGCKLEIEFYEEGDKWIEITATNGETFFNLPANRYHKNWDEFAINLEKRPPLYAPNAVLKAAPDFEFNYIQGKYFQFSVRYIYWDSQKTTTSPFSAVVAQPQKCGQNIFSSNAIEIDFSDSILQTEKYLSDIKYVEILFREGNSGKFKSIEKIEVCDLTFPAQKFVFKNDGSYPVIDDDDAYRPHNYVPIKALCETVVDDRNYTATCLENYNNIDCVDAKVNVSYEPIVECIKETVTIKGKIRIRNFHKQRIQVSGDSTKFNYQPVWSDNGEEFYFGSCNRDIGNRYDKDSCKAHKQVIPMGGFTVYLAGTEYYDISIQQAAMDTIAGSETNVYKINDKDSHQQWLDAANDKKVYSTFEIKNVPKGKTFMLRVGSHLIAPDDRYGSIYNINNGIAWQRTSSYLNRMAEQDITEVQINTGTAVNGVIEVPDFLEIMDFTTNAIGNDFGAALYVIDAVTSHNGDIEDLKSGQSIECADVVVRNFNDSGVIGAKSLVSSPNNKADHNGFYFYSIGDVGLANALDAKFRVTTGGKSIKWSDEAFYKGNLGALYSGSLSSVITAELSSGSIDDFIVYNRTPSVSDFRRTFIQGTIVDQNGDPLTGIGVVSSRCGRIAYTDRFGVFRLMVYTIDSSLYRGDIVMLISKDDCCPKFFSNLTVYIINQFGEGVGKYNAENPFVINRVFEGIINTPKGAIWKHRNNVHLGIKYYEDYAKSTKVQTSDSLKTYIPFWTEDNGNKGLPVVSWEINHLPPPMAVMYQIVRIKNPIYNKYQQFIINEARYIKSFGTGGAAIQETSFEGGDATEIYISLQSLVDYGKDNSSSVLTWEFQKEDRVTLMKDEKGVWFDKYYDVRVENDRTDTLFDSTYLVIKNDSTLPKLQKGVTIEAWNPKSESTQDIFYEITECYPIVNGKHGAGYNGQTQTDSQPAKGVLKFGDSYFVNRKMPIVVYDESTPPEPPPIDTKETLSGIYESEYMHENNADSRVQSIGRFDVEDKDYKQAVYNRTRFSGRYIAQTNINELNRFMSSDYVKDANGTEIDKTFGYVMFLGYTANVLLAVCKFKTVPIYINATQTYEVDGSGSTLMKSSRIANLALPIKEDRGTQNPESVVIENGELYAWDVSKGVYWRYQYSGIFDISDYDANTYWSSVAKQLASSADKRVIASYDRANDEMIVTIPALTETISFNNTFRGEMRKNRWMTFYSYIPDTMSPVHRSFVSFRDGALWVHDKNPNRGSFYGALNPCGIDAVVNISPTSKKDFMHIREIGNALFIAPDKGIVVSGQEGSILQYSQLNAAHFVQEEGDWRADFLRNMNDRNFSDIADVQQRETTALLRGEILKGNTMLIRLRNFEQKEVILYSINVELTDSQTTK